jgi:hypothetical protein
MIYIIIEGIIIVYLILLYRREKDLKEEAMKLLAKKENGVRL